MAFFRLIRPLNLAIIVVIMYTMRYFVLHPGISGKLGVFVKFRLSDLNFFLLVVSTVALAAAGNIINDYFDLRTDRINKPDQVIVGRQVKRRVAMFSHFIINAIAVLLGAWVAWKSGVWQLAFIHVFAASSLWLYSTNFKRQFLIGNLLIALLAAIVPIMVPLFELPPLLSHYGDQIPYQVQEMQIVESGAAFTKALLVVCFAYGGFAFITTLVRELQKDIADIEGDRTVGCRTVPIAWGVKSTKGLVFALILITIGLMAFLWASYFDRSESGVMIYLMAAVALPMIISGVMTFRATDRKSHLLASQMMKVAMVSGICLPIFFDLWSAIY